MALFSWVALAVVPSALAASAGSLTVSIDPQLRQLRQGGATNYLVTVSPSGPIGSVVDLAVSGLPPGATSSLSPSTLALSGSASRTALLTIRTDASADVGSTTFTVTANGSGTRGSGTAQLTVLAAPALNLGIVPVALSLAPGQNGSATVRLGALHGFDGRVQLHAAGGPAGVSATLVPSPVSLSPTAPTGAATLTLRVAPKAPAGSGLVTVTATGAGVTRTVTVMVTVGPAGEAFSIGGSVDGITPGQTAGIDLVLTNPNPTPITVTSLVVALGGSTVPGCVPATSYRVAQLAAAALPLTVPAGSTRSLSQLAVPPARWPAISMLDLTTNPDACTGAVIALTYSGSATAGTD